MGTQSKREQALLDKIRDLSDTRLAQLEDFVDFLRTRDKAERVARLNEVYERYVKPVEQDHAGEYVAVTPDGQLLFGATLIEAMEKSYEMSKTDNFLFKVGEISAVGFR